MGDHFDKCVQSTHLLLVIIEPQLGDTTEYAILILAYQQKYGKRKSQMASE